MTPLEILRLLKHVVEWALPFVPDTDLRLHLSDTARKLDNTIADLAEAAKFGP